MEGEKIRAVNNNMKEFIVKLKDIQDKSDEALIKIAVLSYSGGVNLLTNSPVEISKFQWQDLKASGASNLGAAYEALNDKLSTKEFLPAFYEAYMPAIFLISGGKPSNGWESAFEKLKNNLWYKSAFKAAIGENADREILAKFTCDSKMVFRISDIPNLPKMIRFTKTDDPNLIASFTTIEEEKEFRSAALGRGKITYPDGRVYEGEISDGRPHGYGTGTFVDGRVQEGKWEHGKFLG